MRSLSLMGVPATTTIRSGAVSEEICSEVQENGYDLVVLGAPLTDSGGRISLNGMVGQTLEKITNCAILIVRSNYYRGRIDRINGLKR